MRKMNTTHAGTDDENQTSKPGTQISTRYPLATPPNQKSLASHLLLKWMQGPSMEGYTAQLLLLLGLYLGFLGTLQPLDATHFIALMLTEKPPFQFCASVWLSSARAQEGFPVRVTRYSEKTEYSHLLLVLGTRFYYSVLRVLFIKL